MALMIFDKGEPSSADLREKSPSPVQVIDLAQPQRNNYRQAQHVEVLQRKSLPSTATPNQTLSYFKHDSPDSLENRPRPSAVHIMSSPVHTISTHYLVSHAKNIMREREISHLIVVDADQRPLGILNHYDLIKVENPEQFFIQRLLTDVTLAVSSDTLVREVALSFVKYKATAIAVVDKNTQVIGIIARSDRLNLLFSGPNQQVTA